MGDLYGAGVDRRRQAVTLTTRHYHADSFGPLWTTLDDDRDDDGDDDDDLYDDGSFTDSIVIQIL